MNGAEKAMFWAYTHLVSAGMLGWIATSNAPHPVRGAAVVGVVVAMSHSRRRTEDVRRQLPKSESTR